VGCSFASASYTSCWGTSPELLMGPESTLTKLKGNIEKMADMHHKDHFEKESAPQSAMRPSHMPTFFFFFFFF
jgi:hypothetical protein